MDSDRTPYNLRAGWYRPFYKSDDNYSYYTPLYYKHWDMDPQLNKYRKDVLELTDWKRRKHYRKAGVRDAVDRYLYHNRKSADDVYRYKTTHLEAQTAQTVFSTPLHDFDNGLFITHCLVIDGVHMRVGDHSNNLISIDCEVLISNFSTTNRLYNVSVALVVLPDLYLSNGRRNAQGDAFTTREQFMNVNTQLRTNYGDWAYGIPTMGPVNDAQGNPIADTEMPFDQNSLNKLANATIQTKIFTEISSASKIVKLKFKSTRASGTITLHRGDAVYVVVRGEMLGNNNNEIGLATNSVITYTVN